MKRLLLALAILLCASSAFAQYPHYDPFSPSYSASLYSPYYVPSMYGTNYGYARPHYRYRSVSPMGVYGNFGSGVNPYFRHGSFGYGYASPTYGFGGWYGSW